MGMKKTHFYKRNFVLLAGLPRTGSTLLTALLSQNPIFHTEGSSALCQIMWDVLQSCNGGTALAANNRLETQKDILSELPNIYYKNVDKPIVVDKARTWVHPANVTMWQENVNPDQKIIVMVRPVQDVMRSFVSLRIKNDWQGDLYSDLLQPGAEPIYRAAQAIFFSKQLPQDNFLYVDYRDLIASPLDVLDLIYQFFGWEHFEHNVERIEQKNKEDDTVHGLIGMHDVRETISVRQIDVDLPPYVEAFCEELNQMIYPHKINGEWSMIGPAD